MADQHSEFGAVASGIRQKLFDDTNPSFVGTTFVTQTRMSLSGPGVERLRNWWKILECKLVTHFERAVDENQKRPKNQHEGLQIRLSATDSQILFCVKKTFVSSSNTVSFYWQFWQFRLNEAANNFARCQKSNCNSQWKSRLIARLLMKSTVEQQQWMFILFVEYKYQICSLHLVCHTCYDVSEIV